MPVNLELKARVQSRSGAESQARAAGARECGILRQTDTYFNVPKGRLKMREISGTGAELIQYERNEDSNERWSTYRTIPVADPEPLKQTLTEALGIRVVVRKERTLFLHRGARIHVDDVEGIGSFVEFEVPSPGSEDPKALMRELRKIFDINEELVEKGSYSDLILAKSSRAES